MVNGIKTGKRGIILILSTLVLLLPIGVSFTRPDSIDQEPIVVQISTTAIPPSDTTHVEGDPIVTSSTTESSALSEKNLPDFEQNSLLLSMMDDSHYQLFSFDPSSSLFTQLTDLAYDIITPAISPDGNFLAFSSNRDGYWDLYILDVSTGVLTKITDTPQYDAVPAWSPDGKWLAFESYSGNNLDIDIISTIPGDKTFIQLTDDPAADHSPDWSPDGRYILFVSNRTGDDEIWGADLHTTQDRFMNMSNRPSTADRDPIWSTDGSHLLWSSIEDGSSSIFTQETSTGKTEMIVTGCLPKFNADGSTLVIVNQGPSESLISTYSIHQQRMSSIPSVLPGLTTGIIWISGFTSASLINSIQATVGSEIQTKPEQTIAETGQTDGGISLALLEGINVPQPYLIDDVMPDFNALHRQIEQSIGWNFLDNLENAFIPITQPASPGMESSWLYTGRAIAINTAPLYGNWMSVVREDFNGQTFWRIFLKTRFQDGSQGMPIKTQVWDFATRQTGDTQGYENGGSLAEPPEGYWVDFTTLAGQYGWKRMPAHQNWRSYMDGTLFNQFVHDDNLTWQAAMLELYPPETLGNTTP